MDQAINQISTFLSANPGWVVWAAGLAAFGEALLVVGVFIPGTTLLAIIGGLAASGVVDPVAAGLAAIVGAIAGDTITYSIGRFAGRPVLRWRALRPYRRKIAWARLFFRRYGLWSVIVGRFLGPLRATVPAVAGAFTMRTLPFQIANVASALLWAPVVMLPGWLSARGVAQIGGLDPATLLLAFGALTAVLTIIPILVIRRLTRSRPRGAPR